MIDFDVTGENTITHNVTDSSWFYIRKKNNALLNLISHHIV